MRTKYLLLRTDVPIDGQFDLTKASAWEARRGLVRHFGPQSELRVEVTDSDESSLGDLRTDPRNVAVLDADASLSLVTPRAQASVDTAVLKSVGMLKMPDGLIAVGAHTSPYTGQGVTVAVLDTGIDLYHPTFQNKDIVKRNFTNEGVGEEDVRDANGHGTHCAGTICGGLVDDVRVGIAPGVAKLCVGKVLGAHGGTLEMLINGMLWSVIQEKALVVSMSLSYDLVGNTQRLIAKGVNPALATQVALRQQREILLGIKTLRAFLESRAPNVVFLCAAGNESDRPGFVLDAGLPAVELLAVGAVERSGDGWNVANYSNGFVQVVAPGSDVVSAEANGSWASLSGTSMATPHVAGVAALWAEELRHVGSQNVHGALLSSLKGSASIEPLIDRDPNAVGMGMIRAPQ